MSSETWFTSDMHFGHENIRLPEYANRPYSSVDEMNEALIENWNAVVGPLDTVYVNGDACMGKIAETLPLISRLNGKKILLCGNHDRPWDGHSLKRRKGWLEKYYAVGFAIVVVNGHGELDTAGHHLVLDHFPYVGDSQDEDRYVDHRPKDEGHWLLHGHVHEAWKVRDRMINVGVDVWDYTPVHLDTLLEIVNKGE